MTLRDALEERGRWLFRHRSHLPLLLAPVFLAALVDAPSAAAARIPDWLWATFSLAIGCIGLAVRAATVGFVPAKTSGRSTANQVAADLNTTGMYSILRHPLYLGNLIAITGVTLFFRCWWLVAIVLLAFSLYYERIILAEEAFLRERFGRAFEVWAARVPAIIPNLRLWQPPVLSFSWRAVIRREYHGAVAILAALAGFQCLSDLAVQRRLVFDPLAMIYAAAGGLVFVTCRVLSKHTTVLRVQGR